MLDCVRLRIFRSDSRSGFSGSRVAPKLRENMYVNLSIYCHFTCEFRKIVSMRQCKVKHSANGYGHDWYWWLRLDDVLLIIKSRCDIIWCDVIWYDVIWYDVIWCDVIWCDIMWCDVIWCGMMWYDMMWCEVIWYNVMWCDMIWSDVISCDMIWFDMIWYDTIWYDMIWYDMIWYDMIWYDVIWYDVMWLIILFYCLINRRHQRQGRALFGMFPHRFLDSSPSYLQIGRLVDKLFNWQHSLNDRFLNERELQMKE